VTAAAPARGELARTVRLLARLKLRLLRNGLKTSWQQTLGIVVAALTVLPLAAGVALLEVILGRSNPEAGEILVGGLFVLLGLGWLVGPLIAFGTDETLDPDRLALLPLRPKALIAGLVTASAIGVVPLATILVVGGAVGGLAPLSPGLVLTVAAGLGQIVFCIVAGRALTTGLSGMLRSRRARDLALALVTLSGVAFSLSGQLIGRVAGGIDPGQLDRLEGFVRALTWSPPGLAARAMVDARRGDLGWAVLDLVMLAVVIGLLAAWWHRSLDRLTTTAEPAARTVRGARGLFPRWLGWLPRTPLGATIAKEARILVREPRLRINWLFSVAAAIALPVVVALVPAVRHPEMVLASVALLWMQNANSLNQLGTEGRAWWQVAVSGADPDTDLTGRNLAAMLVSLTVTAVSAVPVAALTGGWLYLPAAVAIGAGLLGTMYGVGDVVSVRAPQPLPEVSGNLWAMGGTGQGCMSALLQMAALTVQSMLLLPLIAGTLIGLFAWWPALVIAAVLAVPYGYLLWWAGRRVASGWLAGHQPELLDALSPRRV
jgi:ABC-2 type transport system permease protein